MTAATRFGLASVTKTSGIADYAEEDEGSPGYVEDYASLWQTRPSYRMLRPADFLPLFGDLPPYRPPELDWQYSSAGYVLLALVVEEVTGLAFPSVVQARVGRCGLAASAPSATWTASSPHSPTAPFSAH